MGFDMGPQGGCAMQKEKRWVFNADLLEFSNSSISKMEEKQPFAPKLSANRFR